MLAERLQKAREENGFSWVIENKLGGMRAPEDPEILLKLESKYNFGLVVSLTEYPLPYKFNDIFPDDRCKNIHIPVTDFSVPKLEQVDLFVAEARKILESGKSVVVHCHAGAGRTGTFLACYFVAEKSTATDAIQAVRSKRSGSICTKGQENFIEKYYQHLYGSS